MGKIRSDLPDKWLIEAIVANKKPEYREEWRRLFTKKPWWLRLWEWPLVMGIGFVVGLVMGWLLDNAPLW